MCWGCEVGNGWYELLSSVCWRIFQHERNISERVRVRTENDKPNDKSDLEYFPVKFDQVKEKYGGLRLYFSGGDDYVDGVVGMAEEYSYKVCERCGNAGKPNKGGWITTLCENCRKETCQTMPQ
jgi:hypothetical protein